MNTGQREKQMKAHYKVAGLTSMLLLLAFGLLWSTAKCERGGRWQDYRNGQTGWRGPAHEGN